MRLPTMTTSTTCMSSHSKMSDRNTRTCRHCNNMSHSHHCVRACVQLACRFNCTEELLTHSPSFVCLTQFFKHQQFTLVINIQSFTKIALNNVYYYFMTVSQSTQFTLTQTIYYSAHTQQSTTQLYVKVWYFLVGFNIPIDTL